MAAQAWELYNAAIGALGSATLDLDAGANIFRLRLFKGTSNASARTLVGTGSVTNAVTSANGYTTVGKTVSATSWTSAAAGVWMFDGENVAWTASGGAITSVVFGVIATSTSATGGAVVCKSKLTTTSFISVGDGGTLTIQMNANGVFRMS
jgi:hypothetical protein